jgi:cell division protein FtsI (penicillin-binding protein 3)
VAGKTGTTNKLVGSSYAPDRFISSFVGFAPVSRPRLIVAVMIDEPASGEHFGGVVAAPVFARVIAGGLRLLAVEHDAPLEDPAALTADGPVIKEEV